MSKDKIKGMWAPGNYYGTCISCGGRFQGDKRAIQCEACGTKLQDEYDALTPEQKEERHKRNIDVYNQFIKDHRNEQD